MFYRNCDRLDVMLYKVPVAQRPNAKMRVDQLKYDVRHLQVHFIKINSIKNLYYINKLLFLGSLNNVATKATTPSIRENRT